MAATTDLIGRRDITSDGKLVATVNVEPSHHLDDPERAFMAMVDTPGGEAWTKYGRSPAAALNGLVDALRDDMRQIRRVSASLVAFVHGEDDI